MVRIPLVEGLYSSVKTTINGIDYKFITQWNDRFEYYSMDVFEANVEVCSGIILNVGVDLAVLNELGLSRVYCINRNTYNEDIGYSGLGDDGLVIMVEDSDLEDE